MCSIYTSHIFVSRKRNDNIMATFMTEYKEGFDTGVQTTRQGLIKNLESFINSDRTTAQKLEVIQIYIDIMKQDEAAEINN